VPIHGQEEIYSFNIAPTVKPTKTGWYVGSQSQPTTSSTSKSTPPQLTDIQQTANTTRQLATVTLPNITKTMTYWVYITQPGPNNTQYVWIKPYFHSQRDIEEAFNQSNADFILGSLKLIMAGNDLLHGNLTGAANNILSGLHDYYNGLY
jgi:hypothetical protein